MQKMLSRKVVMVPHPYKDETCRRLCTVNDMFRNQKNLEKLFDPL